MRRPNQDVDAITTRCSQRARVGCRRQDPWLVRGGPSGFASVARAVSLTRTRSTRKEKKRELGSKTQQDGLEIETGRNVGQEKRVGGVMSCSRWEGVKVAEVGVRGYGRVALGVSLKGELGGEVGEGSPEDCAHD